MFLSYNKVSQFAGVVGVRSTANFFAEVTHCVHLDNFAVSVTEQSNCARFASVLDRHFFARDDKLSVYRFVDLTFRFGNFLSCHWTTKAEVETQTLGSDVATLLLDFIA